MTDVHQVFSFLDFSVFVVVVVVAVVVALR